MIQTLLARIGLQDGRLGQRYVRRALARIQEQAHRIFHGRLVVQVPVHYISQILLQAYMPSSCLSAGTVQDPQVFGGRIRPQLTKHPIARTGRPGNQDPAHEDLSESKLAHTIKKYGIDARRSLPPAPKGAFAIMEELRKRDERLDGTDIMILAQVLVDPDSKFFTKDRKMLYNAEIKKYEQFLRSENLRNENLKITERIGSS